MDFCKVVDVQLSIKLKSFHQLCNIFHILLRKIMVLFYVCIENHATSKMMTLKV